MELVGPYPSTNYTISYNANGGSGAPASQTKTKDVPLTLSTTVPTRTGYTFLGWSASSSATSPTYLPGATYTANSGVTLYAVWKQTSISSGLSFTAPITYGGQRYWYKFVPSATRKYVIYSTGDADTKVYLYDANGNQLTYNNDGGDNTNFRLAYNCTSGTTYYYGVQYNDSSSTGSISVKFGPVYTVSYNANGGSGAPSSQEKDYGKTIVLSGTQPTKSYTITYNANGGTVSSSSKTVNCTFNSWNTSSSGGGTAYSPNGNYSYNADATLYAQWTNPTAGSLTSATRSDYTFDGWFTSATGGTQVTSGTVITGNITVYAHWIDNTAPSGSISSTNNVASSQTVTLHMSDNEGVAGYYWGTSSTYSDNTYTASSASSVTKIVSDPGTYYLRIKDTGNNLSPTYSITFYKTTLNANGGTVSPTSVLTARGYSFTFPAPKLDGCTCKGWSTNKNTASGITTLTPTESETYYAIWLDTEAPIAVVEATNNVAATQTVSLSMTDNVALAGYYWGTSPTYTNNTYVSFGSPGPIIRFVDETVSEPGTYYLRVKDTAGNLSEYYSITFYKTTLNANGGTVSPTSVLTEEGKSFALPTPEKASGTFGGWFTESDGGTRITSPYTVTKNRTLYAHWIGNNAKIVAELWETGADTVIVAIVAEDCIGLLDGDLTVTYNADELTAVKKGGDNVAELGKDAIQYRNLSGLGSIWWIDNIVSAGTLKSAFIIGGGLCDYETYVSHAKPGTTVDIDAEHFQLAVITFKVNPGARAATSITVSVDNSAGADPRGGTYSIALPSVSDEYTATFNINGGSWANGTSEATRTLKYTSANTLIAVFPQNNNVNWPYTRASYVFAGWKVKSCPNGNWPVGTVYGDNWLANKAGMYGDVTFEAQWTYAPNVYTVSYNANGGTGAPSAQQKYQNVTLTLSSATPKKSYTVSYNATGGIVSPASKTVSCTFKNWKNTKTGKTYSPGSGYTDNADAVLYAQWSDPTAGTLATPTRNGYTFAGWYTAADGGVKITSATVITGNTVLYAHWTPIQYTATFYINGGKWGNGTAEAVRTLNYTADKKLYAVFPQSNNKNWPFTREGYTFAGWKVKSCTGNEWTSGAVYKDNTLADKTGLYGDVVFEAQWTVRNNTATFNINGGIWANGDTEATRAVNYATGDKLLAVFPQDSTHWPFTRPSHIFAGWKVKSCPNGNWPLGAVYGDNWLANKAGMYGDVTFEAQWKKVNAKYTATFFINGGKWGDGTAESSRTLQYEVHKKLYAVFPQSNNKNWPFTRDGYTFAGWKVTRCPEGNWQIGKVYPNNKLADQAGMYGPVVFEAQWKQSTDNPYNLGDETYSFANYGDADSPRGHCFGMSITSAGYYNQWIDINRIGGNNNTALYTFSDTPVVRKPICFYQSIQGESSLYATVAGGTFYRTGNSDIYSDWNAVVNYVKDHSYDNTGMLQIGFRKNNKGGHAINFLRYENVNGQDRIYAYDNNFPDRETYFYKASNGNVYQAPVQTFNGAIDCIVLRDIGVYFSIVGDFNASRAIYVLKDAATVQGYTYSYMEGTLDGMEYVMYEIPASVSSVTIIPKIDNADFIYMDTGYSFGTITDNTYGVLTFVTMDEHGVETPSSFKIYEGTPPAAAYGDVDGDGSITSADARLALRAAVGLEHYASGSREFLAADVDLSRTLTAADARLILRRAVGYKDPEWGVKKS